MREERGHIASNVNISEPYTLWGSIGGTVTVGGKGPSFTCAGCIYGDLNVEARRTRSRPGKHHVAKCLPSKPQDPK